jgi:hypothetical protein
VIAALCVKGVARVSERGSIAPLAIGLALLSLAAILTTVAASSLFLHQKRLLSLAESTALFAVATSEPAQTFLSQVTDPKLGPVTVAKEQVIDGQTVEVRLCSQWVSPFALVGLPLTQIVCAEARSRLI